MDDLVTLGLGVTVPDDPPAERRRDLGALAAVRDWLATVQGGRAREVSRPRLVVVAADHGIVEAGVTAQPAYATAATLQALTDGTSPASRLAGGADVPIEVLRCDSSARIDQSDAVTPEQAAAAVAAGAAVADAAVDAGVDLILLAHAGRGATTAAATLVSLLSGTEPVRVVSRGSGIDDEAWMAKVTAIRDARRRAKRHVGSPDALLAAVGGADIAALAGLLVQAAVRRTPVLVEGEVVAAAALAAGEACLLAPRWWLPADADPAPGFGIVTQRLNLTPLLHLGLTATPGVAGLAALPLLRAAAVL